jgi:branched-chain amino acid transport system ATP-binding protein
MTAEHDRPTAEPPGAEGGSPDDAGSGEEVAPLESGVPLEEALLALDDVDTHYGPIHILQRVSIAVREGERVCLLGGNASGKLTTLKTALGIVRPTRGSVYFRGEDVSNEEISHRIERGMAIVPQNRRVFGPMSVLENLEMGAYLRTGNTGEDFERVYELFPRLYSGARRRQGPSRAANSRCWPWGGR